MIKSKSVLDKELSAIKRQPSVEETRIEETEEWGIKYEESSDDQPYITILKM
jgi:hypothetical protein